LTAENVAELYRVRVRSIDAGGNRRVFVTE
jgi:hypothetical protein